MSKSKVSKLSNKQKCFVCFVVGGPFSIPLCLGLTISQQNLQVIYLFCNVLYVSFSLGVSSTFCVCVCVWTFTEEPEV